VECVGCSIINEGYVGSSSYLIIEHTLWISIRAAKQVCCMRESIRYQAWTEELARFISWQSSLSLKMLTLAKYQPYLVHKKYAPDRTLPTYIQPRRNKQSRIAFRIVAPPQSLCSGNDQLSSPGAPHSPQLGPVTRNQASKRFPWSSSMSPQYVMGIRVVSRVSPTHKYVCPQMSIFVGLNDMEVVGVWAREGRSSFISCSMQEMTIMMRFSPYNTTVNKQCRFSIQQDGGRSYALSSPNARFL
jgi:hypothetical protein